MFITLVIPTHGESDTICSLKYVAGQRYERAGCGNRIRPTDKMQHFSLKFSRRPIFCLEFEHELELISLSDHDTILSKISKTETYLILFMRAI